MLEALGLSIIGSIIAAVLLFVTATWRSRTVRKALTAVASSFLRVDVEYVFDNPDQAKPHIQAALKRARVIRILTSRGKRFDDDDYAEALYGRHGPEVRVLIADPESSDPTNDWVTVREVELSAIDKKYGRDKQLLRSQIRTVLTSLSAHVEPGRFTVRRYDLPHFTRIVLTDHCLFLNPYRQDRHGRECPVIQYGRGITYEMYSHYFDLVWERFQNRGLENQSMHS